MATLKDIANEAGVSTATVSRYLSNKITLLPETEARLTAAIEKFHYQPNIIARSLKENRTTNVAVVLPRINSLYYSAVTAGINEALIPERYNLIIYEVANMDRSEQEILELLESNLIAGAIFVGYSHDTSFYHTAGYLQKQGIPVVYANRPLEYCGIPMVYPDFHQCGKLAAEHLIACGKQKAAIVHSGRHNNVLHIYHDSFRDTFLAHGYGAPELILSEADFLPSETCLEQIRKDRIDGIFVLNEMMGSGLIRALTQIGYRIPEDLALVSFGNTTISEVTTPSLTCIDLQDGLLGRRSAELIMDQIHKKEVQPVTILEPLIIKRESAM